MKCPCWWSSTAPTTGDWPRSFVRRASPCFPDPCPSPQLSQRAASRRCPAPGLHARRGAHPRISRGCPGRPRRPRRRHPPGVHRARLHGRRPQEPLLSVDPAPRAGLVRRRGRGFSAACRELRDSGVPAERIVTIPNGLPPHARARPRPPPRGGCWACQRGVPHRVGGPAEQEKGPDLLLEALARPGATGLRRSASIIGDGPLRARLESMAESLGIADMVRWHGPIPGAARLFPAFDALVLSSRTEGTPWLCSRPCGRRARHRHACRRRAGCRRRHPREAGPFGGPGALAAALAAAAREPWELAPASASVPPDAAGAPPSDEDGDTARDWLDAYEELYARVARQAARDREPVETRTRSDE